MGSLRDALLQVLPEYRRRGRRGPTWSPPSPVEIRKTRESLDLTQVQFAERFGIPVGSVRNWEQGIREPDPGIARLYKMLKLRPDDTIRLLDEVRDPIEADCEKASA